MNESIPTILTFTTTGEVYRGKYRENTNYQLYLDRGMIRTIRDIQMCGNSYRCKSDVMDRETGKYIRLGSWEDMPRKEAMAIIKGWLALPVTDTRKMSVHTTRMETRYLKVTI